MKEMGFTKSNKGLTVSYMTIGKPIVMIKL